MKKEFNIVDEFTAKLGLKNQTDGSLFIYKKIKSQKQSLKPDGYYYYEGITFILDAKSQNAKFSGQLADYMELESNEHYIGFEYNGTIFKCYVNGKFKPEERELKDKDYYKDTYFPNKINNEIIVNNSAKKLANHFRNSGIDKQMNVPFIGAVILCMKYGKEINLSASNTNAILRSITVGINEIINDNPINRRQKKEFITNKVLIDSTLKEAKYEDLYNIIAEISTIYNFINISAEDYKGHDIMNNFLKVFRRWNSANANEKGEVFTPDHIAQLMYSLAECNKDDFILDPTCGSGTFLTNAMANMFNEALAQSVDNTSFQKEQKDIKENRLIGIEKNDFNATLAGINMLLHGDGASNIYYENCFDRIPSLVNLYNKVLMNPPFSQKDIELKFVYEALKYMESNKKKGILASILPKSCLKGTIEANVEYLEKIFKLAHLKAVISLPRDLFYPVGADTCIIVLEKGKQNLGLKTLLINCLDDGFKVINEWRVDTQNKWESIQKEVLKAYNGEYDEYRAIEQNIKANDEILFEAYSSHRPMDIPKESFERYIREKVSAKVLCGMPLVAKHKENVVLKEPYAYKRFAISDLIYKLEKGKEEKSIDRTLENKFQNGIPLMVAKKDNNGIGGLRENPKKTYKDKICIITGGDGGGGKTYYCDFEFCATSFVMICDFIDELKDIDRLAKFYISIVISERIFKTIAHGRTIKEVPNEIKIKLPVLENDKLDIEYMKNYIQNLNYSEFL